MSSVECRRDAVEATKQSRISGSGKGTERLTVNTVRYLLSVGTQLTVKLGRMVFRIIM